MATPNVIVRRVPKPSTSPCRVTRALPPTYPSACRGGQSSLRAAMSNNSAPKTAAAGAPASASSLSEHARFLAFLPEATVGVVQRLEPIRMGLSGASVFAVTTSRGAYVLRVKDSETAERFAQQVAVFSRAAAAGIAPAVVHVDEAARAVVSQLIQGVPLSAALADPTQRGPVLASVVDGLRKLHALDPAGVSEGDPLSYTREVWAKLAPRAGVPAWAQVVPAQLDAIAAALSGDTRRAVNHNDVNPGNLLWDGKRAWLIDWEAVGVGHPYFDLATLAMFLQLDDEGALALVARHDEAPLDERSIASFRALLKLAGILSGSTVLGLVDDLSVRPAPTRAEAPTLGEFFAGMRSGQLDLQTPLGQASLGLALLALGVAD